MSGEGIKSSWVCPQCGRQSRPSEPRCWFCAAPRPGATEVASAPGPTRRPAAPAADEDYPPPPTEPEVRWRLRRQTARLIILVCVPLIMACGIGVPLLLALAPTLYYLLRWPRERPPGASIPPSDATELTSAELRRVARIPGFLRNHFELGKVASTAAGITALVVISSLITFVAVCGPTGAYALSPGQPPSFQALAWLAGLLGGMTAAGGLGYGIVALIFRRLKGE